MNAFLAVVLLAVAASAGHVHHIPSGSISVGHKGVVIAGPAGSVHTDNGLHGHGAGARLSGPAGDVRTHGGHVELDGPGIGHHGGWGGDGGNDGGDGGWGGNDGGNGGWGHGHVAVVQHVVPVVQHVVPVAIAHGHHGISHGLIGHGAIGHGLIGHGHGGW